MKDMKWEELKNALQIGKIIPGSIKKHESYGMFVDIGYAYNGLIQITDLNMDEGMTPEQYPSVGDNVNVEVLAFKDHGYQIWLRLVPDN